MPTEYGHPLYEVPEEDNHHALANEWITKDPFIGIKFHEKEVIREFLTLDELHRIYNKEFSLDRITVVRDVFIFASFTGLAFMMCNSYLPNISFKITMAIIGFASLAKRRRICATFPCSIFRCRFWRNTKAIRLAKRKMCCSPSPAIKR